MWPPPASWRATWCSWWTTPPPPCCCPPRCCGSTRRSTTTTSLPLIGTYLQIVRTLVLLLTIFVTPLWYLLVKNPDTLHENLHFLLVEDEYYVPLIIQLLLVELIIDVLKLASLNTPDVLSNSFQHDRRADPGRLRRPGPLARAGGAGLYGASWPSPTMPSTATRWAMPPSLPYAPAHSDMAFSTCGASSPASPSRWYSSPPPSPPGGQGLPLPPHPLRPQKAQAPPLPLPHQQGQQLTKVSLMPPQGERPCPPDAAAYGAMPTSPRRFRIMFRAGQSTPLHTF